MNKLGDECVLEDRTCTECGKCDLCDLNPSKQCDNCCQCIEFPVGDFAEIEIDDILLNTDKLNPAYRQNEKSKKYKVKL